MLCLQIFTRATERLSLTSAPPNGDGGLLRTFFKRQTKIALKCSVLDEGSLEPKEVASWDFATWRAARWGNNAGTTFRGHRPLKIWEGNVQNLVRFTITFEFERKYLW